MTDDLTRRMADHLLAAALADLARDARRLADAATHYADSVPTAALHGDAARRLVHDAANLLVAAARLDGMRTIDPLVPGPETP